LHPDGRDDNDEDDAAETILFPGSTQSKFVRGSTQLRIFSRGSTRTFFSGVNRRKIFRGQLKKKFSDLRIGRILLAAGSENIGHFPDTPGVSQMKHFFTYATGSSLFQQ